MPSIYYCEFLGDSWSDWEGGFTLPYLPEDFDEDNSTVTFSSSNGEHLCYGYDPELGALIWCSWDGEVWSDWEGFVELPAPENWLVDEIPAQFSASSHEDGEWIFSYNPSDGSIHWSPWLEDGYGDWDGPVYVSDPPNLDDAVDVFVAGDGENEWLIAVNVESWSVFFAVWDGESFGEWQEAPDLPIDEEWLELGVDLDGDGRAGKFWIYATVYDDELFEE